MTLACEVVTVETVVEVAGSVVLFIESGAVRPDSESKLWESIFAPSGDSSCGLNMFPELPSFGNYQCSGSVSACCLHVIHKIHLEVMNGRSLNDVSVLKHDVVFHLPTN